MMIPFPRIQICVLVFLGSVGGSVGCFVQPREDCAARVNVDLVLPLQAGGAGAHVAVAGVRKASFSEVDLQADPFVVHAFIEADDMADSVQDRFAGEIPSGATPVSLMLETPSGPERRLRVVAFLWDGSTVATYRYFETLAFLAPGDQTVEAPLEPVVVWTLEGTLKGFGELPESVVLQDILTGVRFPDTVVQPEGNEGRFFIADIPVGRFFYLRIRDAGGELSEPLYFCPVFFGQAASIARTIDVINETC